VEILSLVLLLLLALLARLAGVVLVAAVAAGAGRDDGHARRFDGRRTADARQDDRETGEQDDQVAWHGKPLTCGKTAYVQD
jgi:hypothetical protein